MNISAIFIQRPVATVLLTLGILLAGFAGLQLLPIAPLPQVEFPTISVQANLPGASPETMAATVATPLERALGRIAGVNEITSSSSLGSTRVVLQFDLNRDINGAAREVQAAINAARSLLPSGMPSNPTYRKVNPASAPIMILALTSDTMTRGQMFDAGSTVLAQKLSQLKGVGQVNIGGGALPAVRIAVNLPVANQLGLDLEDVRQAVSTANSNRPKGAVDDAQRHWQIQTNQSNTTAADFQPLIVRYQNGSAVRLSDIAKVTDSVQDVRNIGMTNGKSSVQLMIFRQPGANILETVEEIKKVLPQLRASIPEAINVQVVMERTMTIRASLHEIIKTLLISVALVIGVVYLFLRSGRATLIPAIAVPVSLVGTCAVMYLLGYSLNNLTLIAMTIATGFVVDDAIVVLENISRHIENGMKPVDAALRGAKEVGFTVVSISLSLTAVFIPVLAMGGIIGRLFREFAVTLSVAILVSLFVSLTTTPMMCSRLLQAKSDTHKNVARWKLWLENRFDSLNKYYVRTLRWTLNHAFVTVGILVAIIALNVALYIAIPKGFFPQQDIGLISGSMQADQSISFQAMEEKLRAYVEIARADPAIANVVAFSGGGQRNGGSMFITLKPIEERDVDINGLIQRLRRSTSKVAGASLFLSPVQDIRVGGRSSQAQYQYTLQADDFNELRQWEPHIREALAQIPELTDVNTDQQDRAMQTTLVIDHNTAARMGITPRMINVALSNAFSQRQVSVIYAPLNQYRVVLEAAPEFLQSPSSLADMNIITANGNKIPFSSFARYEPGAAPLSLQHQGQFPASTISFNLARGTSLSQATDLINAALVKIGVPTSIRGSFQGTARAFQQSTASQPWLILTAIISIYLILGMLYESYLHPITILSTLPSAGIGALLALLLADMEFSIMALIGVFLLIGIVKKNAILMIDFALTVQRDRGLSPHEAIVEGARMRLRPILMTTMAALLGALPLALGTGYGAELRVPLGISIVGGLLVSQILTLYTTPAVYLVLDRLRGKLVAQEVHA